MPLEDLPGRVRRLFARPVLADPEADRTAGSAHTLALCLVALASVQTVVLSVVLEQPRRALEFNFALFSFCLAALLLVRRGWARVASALLVAVLYLCASGAVILAGRIGAALAIFYVLAILTAGLLLGGRAVVGVAVLCAATGGVLASLEQRGLLVAWLPYNTWSSWWAQVVAFLFAAVLLRDALGRLRGALQRTESSEAEARAVFEQASDGIVIANGKGELLDANARAAEIAGISREDLVRRGLGGVLQGEQLAAALRRFAELEPGAVRFRELRLPRADGSARFLEATTTTLSDGRVLSIVRDVTEQRRDQAELEQIRTAMDHLREGIVLFGSDARVLYANRALEAFFAGELPIEPGLPATSLARSPGSAPLVSEVAGAIRENRKDDPIAHRRPSYWAKSVIHPPPQLLPFRARLQSSPSRPRAASVSLLADRARVHRVSE